ncbi:MAG: hypothetical protein MRZ54_02170, partial [Clostridiales bacterium]|nr:hypothetical protein [Clostridiales bacterium]
PLAHLNVPETASYFRVANALDASKLILTAMRNRRESRGSLTWLQHFIQLGTQVPTRTSPREA